MIDLTNNTIISSKQNKYSVELSELVCISSLTETYIDSRVISVNSNVITIKGDFAGIVDMYAVVKGEIVYIQSSVLNGLNTDVTVLRNQMGTVQADILALDYFRTVNIFLDTKDYSYKEGSSSTNNVFDLSLNNGSVTLFSIPALWDNISDSYTYKWKPKKNYVYYFSGIENEIVLRATTILKTVKCSYKDNTVTISFRDKLYLYWDLNIYSNSFLSKVSHKDFLSAIFNIDESYIKYANNLTEDDFDYIRNVPLSEYTEMSALLTDYVKSGVRIKFDCFEYLILYSDKYIENLTEVTSIREDYIKDYKSNGTDRLIFNKVNSEYDEYGTVQDFSALGEKYVSYSNSYSVSGFTLISNDNIFNTLTITNSSTINGMYLAEKVVLKDNTLGIEIQGIVVEKNSDNIKIEFTNQSKDSKLDFKGKIDYLISLDFHKSRDFTLYYTRNELPIIWKDNRTFDSGTVTESMNKPILPTVLNSSEEVVLTNKRYISATFGDLDIPVENVSYTGNYENIDSLYGEFTQSDLIYNQEISQFDNTKPPIMILSNRITSAKGNLNSIISYDTFDNSNIEIKVSRTTDYNAYITLNNTTEILESDLYESTYISKLSHSVLQINGSTLSNYNVGDVLVVKKPTAFDNLIDKALYEDTLSTIKWTILSIIESAGNYYLYLDSDFPDDYTWIRYPSTSIVYLQSLYFRGNPVIKKSTKINYTIDEESVELFEESNVDINSNFLDKEGFRKLINYYSYFAGTNINNTKTIKTMNVWGNINLELFDIITLNTQDEEDNIKYVILSRNLTSVSKGNSQQFTIMNINTNSIVEVDLPIYETIEYTPINIPNGYSPSGNEGDSSLDNTSTSDIVIDSRDEELGNIGLTLISPESFYAKISTLDSNIITFSSTFYGTNQISYSNAFFSETGGEEFVIRVENELIYCLSVANTGSIYKAQILKRGFIDNSIYYGNLEGLYVKFYEITNKLSGEDGFVSTKAYIGDQFNYMKFDRILGLDIKTIGDAQIENPMNRFFMDKLGTSSQLLLNVPEGDWASLNTNVKFQIGGGSGLASNNFIRYRQDTGIELAGVMSLSSSDSYIDFDAGFKLKSYSSTTASGIRFVGEHTSETYPDSNFTFQRNGDDFTLDFGLSQSASVVKEVQISTVDDFLLLQHFRTLGNLYAPVKIHGLVLSDEHSNPSNGSIRLNSNLVQVYYNGSWQTIATLT